MAELNVQPKSKPGIWIWFLLAAIAIGLIFFLSKACNNTDVSTTDADSSGTAAAATSPSTSTQSTTGDIDFNSPKAAYDEITGDDIDVRGSDKYAIYSLGENILFDTDNSQLRSGADAQLKQVAASLNKRFPSANIRIYGHADATGDAAHNKELSKMRGESVKRWLAANTEMKESVISLVPLGESDPVASNSTESGKQQNRSVEIVAIKP